MRGGAKVVVQPHRHDGVFIARGKEDALVTRNLVPGESVYGEKRISVEVTSFVPFPLFSVSLTDLFADLTFFIFGFCSCSQEGEQKIEYRVWNPFRSKIAAAILGGVDNIHISPGKKVLYLGAASGTTVSHVADIVGPEGLVYAVEFSHRSGRDLINVAKKRTNVIPIIEDARRPEKYRMLVGMVSLPSFISENSTKKRINPAFLFLFFLRRLMSSSPMLRSPTKPVLLP